MKQERMSQDLFRISGERKKVVRLQNISLIAPSQKNHFPVIHDTQRRQLFTCLRSESRVGREENHCWNWKQTNNLSLWSFSLALELETLKLRHKLLFSLKLLAGIEAILMRRYARNKQSNWNRRKLTNLSAKKISLAIISNFFLTALAFLFLSAESDVKCL